MCDCVAYVGVTMEDLYHRDDWNFVFGLAETMEGMGVFSFHRYDPGPDLNPDMRQLLVLQRSCKVMTHELGHLFGLKHCIYFRCLMNGSNHLEELDDNGLFLCPVCLAKLLDTFRWDLAKHYTALFQTAQELGFMSANELALLATLKDRADSFQAVEGSMPPNHVDWQQLNSNRKRLGRQGSLAKTCQRHSRRKCPDKVADSR